MSIISIINSRAAKLAAVAILVLYAAFATYRGMDYVGAYHRVVGTSIMLGEQLKAAQEENARAASKEAHLEFIQARHEDEVAKYKKAAYLAEREAEKWKNAYVKASSHDLELETLRKEHAEMTVELNKYAGLHVQYDDLKHDLWVANEDLKLTHEELEQTKAYNAELRSSYDNAVDEVAALLTDKDDLTIKLADQEAVTEQLLYELFFACEDEHTMRRKADMWRDKCLQLQHHFEAAAE